MFDYKKCKLFIQEKGWKQKYVSEKTNIPENTLSDILNGKIKCSLSNYNAICKCCGVDYSFFIKESSDNKPS